MLIETNNLYVLKRRGVRMGLWEEDAFNPRLHRCIGLVDTDIDELAWLPEQIVYLPL